MNLLPFLTKIVARSSDYYQVTAVKSLDGGAANILSAFFGLGLVIWILGLTLSIISLIALWKIFKKAGKTPWHALIPFLNSYDLMEIAGYNGLLFLIIFVPIIGTVVFSILLAVGISKKFGKDTLFAVLTFFFTPIMYLILAFGDAQYQGTAGTGGFNPFQDGSNNNGQQGGDAWVNGQQ